MQAVVNLDKVQEFVENPDFIQYLIEHNTDLTIPLFILQMLTEKIEELKAQ